MLMNEKETKKKNEEIIIVQQSFPKQWQHHLRCF